MVRLLFLLLFLAVTPLKAEVRRALLIGVDSAEWRVLDPLLAQRQMPNLEGLLSRGCSVALRGEDPVISPAAWTSVVTGKTPAQHGIHGFDPVFGVPLSSARRARALWNILSEKDMRVLVSFFLGTYPVEPVRGVMIAKEFWSQGLTATTVFPMDAFGQVPPDIARSFWQSPNLAPDPHIPEYSVEALRRAEAGTISDALANDESATRATEFFLARSYFDAAMIHLWGLDWIQHAFMDSARPVPRRSASRLDRDEVVAEYYRFLDGVIGRLQRHALPEALILVVSDHGMEAIPRPLLRRDGVWQPSGTHAREAMLVITGPGVRRCERREHGTLYDVAPTLLYLLGLPVAEDMAGRPMAGLIDPAFARAHPPVSIPSYEVSSESRSSVAAPAADPKSLELLRRLGYIQ